MIKRTVLLCGLALVALAPAHALAAGWAPVGDVPVDATTFNPLDPAVDGQGNAWITEVSHDAMTAQVFERSPGGSFASVTTVSGSDGGCVPQIAAGADGTVALIVCANGSFEVLVHHPGEAAFEPPIAEPGSHEINDIRAFVLPSGAIVIGYDGGLTASATRVALASLAPRASSLTTETISGEDSAAYGMDMAMSPTGAVLIAWNDEPDASTARIASVERPAAGPSGPLAAVTVRSRMLGSAETTQSIETCSVALDAADDALVVWDVFTSGSSAGYTEDLQVSSRSGAGSFSPRITLEHGVSVTPVFNPLVQSASAVLDTSGAATIVWDLSRDALNGAMRAVTASRSGGYAFPVDDPATIAPAGTSDYDPQIRALSSGGVAGIAFFHVNTGIQPILSSQTPGGLTLGTAFGTAADEANHEDPVADASGDLLVVASGTNRISHVFAYDATPPVAGTITAPVTVAPGTAATLSSSATDALTGVTVTWSFGDGQMATGASVAHVWATPGVYTVTATATDGAGNTSAAAPVTVAVPAPPPAPAPAPLRDTIAPLITSASLTHRSFAVGPSPTATARAAKAKAKPKQKAKPKKKKAPPKGATITFKLSEAAKVVLTFTRSTPGTKSGKTCRATTKKVAKAKQCTATVTDGKLTRTEKAGPVKVAFSGRIGRTALKAGKHTLSIAATDAAGNASHPKVLHLTIVKA